MASKPEGESLAAAIAASPAELDERTRTPPHGEAKKRSPASEAYSPNVVSGTLHTQAVAHTGCTTTRNLSAGCLA